MLETTLEEEEELNMDMIWEVVDLYRQAILLTREKQASPQCYSSLPDFVEWFLNCK